MLKSLPLMGIAVACGCSMQPRIVVHHAVPSVGPIRTVALFPDNSYVAEGVGGMLGRRDVEVMYDQGYKLLLTSNDEDEAELMRPEQLARFREGGVDAIILCVAKPASEEAGEQEGTLHTRVIGTHDEVVLAHFSLEVTEVMQGGSPDDPRTIRAFWNVCEVIADALMDNPPLARPGKMPEQGGPGSARRGAN